MPTIDLYESQETPRPLLFPVQQEIGKNVGEAVGEGLQKIGGALMERAAKLQTERNQMDALEAYFALNDESREFMAVESEKLGANASGAVTRGEKFFSDRIKAYSQNLNPDAKNYFLQRAMQLRDGSLDSLSGHQVKQHRARMESVLDGEIAALQDHIDAGAVDSDALETRIEQINTTIDSIYDGLDTTKQKENIRNSAIKAWLVDQSIRNPHTIGENLDKYANEIGADDADKILTAAEKRLEELYTEKVDKLITAAGDSPEEWIERLNEMRPTLPIDVYNKLLNAYTNQYNTMKGLDQAKKKELQDTTESGAIKMWLQKDFASLIDYVEKEMPDRERARFWITQAEAAMDEISKGRQSRFEKDDPEVLGILLKDVTLNPQNWSRARIWQFLGQGVSTQGMLKLEKQWEDAQKWGPRPQFENALKVLDELHDNAAFFPNDPAKNEIEYFTTRNEFFDWVRENPDKDPMDFIRSISGSIQLTSWKKWINYILGYEFDPSLQDHIETMRRSPADREEILKQRKERLKALQEGKKSLAEREAEILNKGK